MSGRGGLGPDPLLVTQPGGAPPFSHRVSGLKSGPHILPHFLHFMEDNHRKCFLFSWPKLGCQHSPTEKPSGEAADPLWSEVFCSNSAGVLDGFGSFRGYPGKRKMAIAITRTSLPKPTVSVSLG